MRCELKRIIMDKSVAGNTTEIPYGEIDRYHEGRYYRTCGPIVASPPGFWDKSQLEIPCTDSNLALELGVFVINQFRIIMNQNKQVNCPTVEFSWDKFLADLENGTRVIPPYGENDPNVKPWWACPKVENKCICPKCKGTGILDMGFYTCTCECKLV
jgi:hypothetical protein